MRSVYHMKTVKPEEEENSKAAFNKLNISNNKMARSQELPV